MKTAGFVSLGLGVVLTIFNVITGGFNIYDSIINYRTRGDRFEIQYLTVSTYGLYQSIIKSNDALSDDSLLGWPVVHTPAFNWFQGDDLYSSPAFQDDCNALGDALNASEGSAEVIDPKIFFLSTFALVRNVGKRRVEAVRIEIRSEKMGSKNRVQLLDMLDLAEEWSDLGEIETPDLEPAEGVLLPLGFACIIREGGVIDTEFMIGPVHAPYEIRYQDSVWGREHSASLRGPRASPATIRAGVEDRG